MWQQAAVQIWLLEKCAILHLDPGCCCFFRCQLKDRLPVLSSPHIIRSLTIWKSAPTILLYQVPCPNSLASTIAVPHVAKTLRPKELSFVTHAGTVHALQPMILFWQATAHAKSKLPGLQEIAIPPGTPRPNHVFSVGSNSPLEIKNTNEASSPGDSVSAHDTADHSNDQD